MTFLAELRNISIDCEFRASLDEMQRDRLLCGTNNERIQKRLLGESKLSLKKATDIVLAIEMAEKDILDLHKPTRPVKTESNSEVNKLQANLDNHRKPKAIDTKECYPCGGSHDSDVCLFKDTKCHACGKTGHISRVCRSKREKGRSGRTQDAHHIHEEELEEQDSNPYPFHTMQNKRFRPYKVEIKIEGNDLDMEIDTGVSLSVISEKAFKALCGGEGKFPVKKTNVCGEGETQRRG